MKNKSGTKTRLGYIICVAWILSMGTATAFAGEITGNGKRINVNGKSLCAYSGQQDDAAADKGTFKGDRVQSWGQIPKATRDFLVSLAMYFHPGEGCNPTKPNPPL
jgi:hypothetical protein